MKNGLLVLTLCVLAWPACADVRFSPEDIADMYTEQLLTQGAKVAALRDAPESEAKKSGLKEAEHKLAMLLTEIDAKHHKFVHAGLDKREAEAKDALAKHGDTMKDAQKAKLTQRLKAIEVVRAKVPKTAALPGSRPDDVLTLLAGLLLSGSLMGFVLVQRRKA